MAKLLLVLLIFAACVACTGASWYSLLSFFLDWWRAAGPLFCKRGRLFNPMKYFTSSSVVYIDGKANKGNDYGFVDGTSCVLTYLLPTSGDFCKAKFWSYIGNRVFRYRCRIFDKGWTSNTVLQKWNKTWTDCNFDDSTWTVDANVINDDSGTTAITRPVGTYTGPLLCRAYVRCGPKDTVTTTAAPTTTTMKPTTATTAAPTTATTKAPGGGTGSTAAPTTAAAPTTTATAAPPTTTAAPTLAPTTAAAGTTTLPPIRTQCDLTTVPSVPCVVFDANFNPQFGSVYTLTINFKGWPEPVITARSPLGSIPQVEGPTWLNYTETTYQYIVSIVVDYESLGQWTITGSNDGVAVPIPTPLTISVNQPTAYSLDSPQPGFFTNHPLRDFGTSGALVTKGVLFQFSSCEGLQVLIGTASYSEITELPFVSIDPIQGLLLFGCGSNGPFNEILSRPLVCDLVSDSFPGWMAVTLTYNPSATTEYVVRVYMQDYMTTPAVYPINDDVLEMEATLPADQMCGVVPDAMYFGTSSGTPVPISYVVYL